MNPKAQDLIVAVVSYFTERGESVTKTKLLKLLYLFDVAFYRVHRTTFTAFEWKYFHLGPWTREFDTVLDQLAEDERLDSTPSTNPEFETRYYRAIQPLEAGQVLPAYADERILRDLLNMWGDAQLGEILDHVYFRTEPMEHGVRNEPLDFSRIPSNVAPRYERTPSNTLPKHVEALRRKLAEANSGRQQTPFEFTPPRYDTEFERALDKLDKAW